jgi:ATPase family AAA domain-containing protein 3A/B
MIFGAFHLTKLSVALLTSAMMGRFGKPQLVRETSKIYTSNYAAIPWMWTKKFVRTNVVKRSENDLLKGIILDKKLEDQLREISYAVLHRRQHYAPAKNMLFYGPPGTGKTLFAKKLAMDSGMEYAVMVGSDIAPLGPMAVSEINNLFDWAEKQPNGIVLFIDEADAFLRSRKGNDISEYMRHTINSFLYRTGTPSEKVVLVMATNNPEQLDEAIHDRIDEVVGFNLPNENERKIMLFHYLVKYCQPPQTTLEKLQFVWKYPRSLIYQKKLIAMEGVSKDVIERIAAETEGFSGREITKMVIAWHDAAFTLPDAVLTPDIMDKILHKFHLQHKLKETWTADESKLLEKLIFAEEDIMKGTKEVDGEKDEDMVRRQEELMSEINQERLNLKEDRVNEEIKDAAKKTSKKTKKL